jgi:hypothetical protein
MAADSLRYFCLRCRRPLVNDPTDTKRNRNDTVTAIKGRDEVRHDDCGGMVSMSWREAQAR